MLKNALFATAALVLTGSVVSAADLPSRKGPAIMPAFVAFSWTGFYAGVNAGYAWGETETSVSLGGRYGEETAALRERIATAAGGKLKPSGFAGGVQAGYNHQIGSLVVGLEVDVNYVDLQKSELNSITVPATFTFRRSTDLNWVGTVRPRLGYAVDRTLLYVTGGLAVAGVEDRWSLSTSTNYRKSYSKSDTRVGWAIGAGVEHAFAPNWSAKLEYLYTDLGSKSGSSVYAQGSAFVTPPYDERIKNETKFHTVRAGLNYRF